MILKSILNQDQIDAIQEAIADCPNIEKQERYGRYMYHDVIWKENATFRETVLEKVKELTGKPYMVVGSATAEYTLKAGKPNLPPHFDGDQTDLIMTYQLPSNRQWGVGVDLKVYDLEDNDGVIFHPNESIHWRPNAEFKDGEFVRVMFIRFMLPSGTDYSHKAASLDDPIFDEVKAFRDSL
jgi:hypothetical protein